MPEVENRAMAATYAHVTAVRLDLGRNIDMWSSALTVFALIILICDLTKALTIQLILIASILIGSTQKYLALRVAFDAQIFAKWAKYWSKSGEASVESTMAAFDQASDVNGQTAKSGHTRDIFSRIQGAGKLAMRQSVAFAIQIILWLGAAIVATLT
jgi:hypothetical protein